MWDLNEPDNKQGWTIQNESRIKCVVCSPDGSTALSSSADNTVRLWDLEAARQYDQRRPGSNVASDKPEYVEEHSGRIDIVRFSLDGQHLASGDSSGRICLWDGNTGELKSSMQGHHGQIQWLVFLKTANGSVRHQMIIASKCGTQERQHVPIGSRITMTGCAVLLSPQTAGN